MIPLIGTQIKESKSRKVEKRAFVFEKNVVQ
jgi:hypothetical protein